jgi:hypothetical protein
MRSRSPPSLALWTGAPCSRFRVHGLNTSFSNAFKASSLVLIEKKKEGLRPIVFYPCTRKREHGAPVQGGRLAGKLERNLCDRPLVGVVLNSLGWMAKNLLQAHGGWTVGLAEVFVDLIPVIHPWSGKAN